jgi:beta-galactosidase
VTYVGTLPDRTLATALGRWLRPTPDAWADRPDTVTVTGARNPAGGRLRFVSNWSWEPARLRVPEPVRDLLSGIDIGRAQQLDLEPWSVRVLVEEARLEHNEGGSTP